MTMSEARERAEAIGIKQAVFSDADVVRTVEPWPMILVDLDADDQVVAIVNCNIGKGGGDARLQ